PVEIAEKICQRREWQDAQVNLAHGNLLERSDHAYSLGWRPFFLGRARDSGPSLRFNCRSGNPALLWPTAAFRPTQRDDARAVACGTAKIKASCDGRVADAAKELHAAAIKKRVEGRRHANQPEPHSDDAYRQPAAAPRIARASGQEGPGRALRQG